jgi:polypeptide N-acetylgalactosaminyltransferase
MVGAAYAVDSKYFGEIGAYDEGMTVWGGENLEMSWRVSFCRLLLLIISHSLSLSLTHARTHTHLLFY